MVGKSSPRAIIEYEMGRLILGRHGGQLVDLYHTLSTLASNAKPVLAAEHTHGPGKGLARFPRLLTFSATITGRTEHGLLRRMPRDDSGLALRTLPHSSILLYYLSKGRLEIP